MTRTESSQPRTLVLSRRLPGVGSGAEMRLGSTLRALATLGPVDLLWLAHADAPEPARPPTVDHLWRADWPSSRMTALAQLAWVLTSGAPIELAGKSTGPLRDRLLRLRAEAGVPSHDLVWCYGPFAGELALALETPYVTDLYDLLDRVILGSLEVRVRSGGAGSSLRRCRNRLNARRWARRQLWLARNSAAITVCSARDRERLGFPRAVVLPNVYELTGPALGREPCRRPPTILFQGSMLYDANVDGARFLVEEIAPRLWTHQPDARLLLAGRADQRVLSLARPGRVEVTGWVERIEPVLARADLVAVPLRFGSGTRLKIVEALAHGIPVVSTPEGAEGLDLEPGRHALIAREPEEFSLACVKLIEDLPTRRRLIEEGRRLHADRYSLEVLRRTVTEVVVAALGPRTNY